MPYKELDSRNFKRRTRDKWNAAAVGWHKWMPRMREWFAPATNLMLDLARIGSGSRLLDVAAGDGDQSLAAAGRVGSSGYVLATDLAGELLALADLATREAGLSNLETRVMDGEALELPDASFDAVICRFGLVFFSDPDRGLNEMKRVLKPGGRVSVVVHAVGGSPEFTLASFIIRRHAEQPEPGPGEVAGYNLGAPGVLEQKLQAAGFCEIETHPVSLALRLASADECVQCMRDAYPTLREMLSPFSPQEREEAWQEIQAALAVFEGPAGLKVPNKVLVVAGSAA